MAITDQQLADHVTNNPNSVTGLTWTGKTDQEVFDLVHDKTVGLTINILTSINTLVQWCAGSVDGGDYLLDAIYKNRDSAIQTNSAVRASSLAAWWLFHQSQQDEIDLNDPVNVGLVDALVAGGVMTATQKTNLMTQLANRAASTLEVSFGENESVKMGTVQRARILAGG